MYEINLVINGQPVKLSDFPREIITKTILAMMQSLKEVEEIKTLELTIKK